MRKAFSKLHLIVGALVLGLCLGSVPSYSFAQEEKKEEKGDEKKAARFDPATAKKLTAAYDALIKEEYDKARGILDTVNPAKLGPNEIAQLEQLYVNCDIPQQKFDSARVHMKKAIDSGGLTEVAAANLKYQLATTFLAQERWKEAIVALNDFFATTPKPNSQAYYTLAIAYYKSGDTGKALEPAQKAIDIAEKPQAAWLELLLALRLEREEYKQTVPILRRLIALNPQRKAYWIQLSSTQLQLGDYAAAIVPIQLANKLGLLTEEREYRQLVDSLMRADIPFRAAKVLSESLDQKKMTGDAKIYELLGNAWISARDNDKAIVALKKAAEASGTGDIFLRIAEVYLDREDWPNVESNARRAIDKGNVKRAGQAQLILGYSLMSQKKYKEALDWLQRAAQKTDTKKDAENLIDNIRQLQQQQNASAE